MQRNGRKLGLLAKSPPDYRDHPYDHLATMADVALPDHIDLREMVNGRGQLVTPRVFDQGDLGSCTANASTAVVEYVEHLDGDPDWDRLSRLYVYWYSREKIGTTGEDSGALITDAFAVLAERGAPREKYWPYDVGRFRDEPVLRPEDEWRVGEHRALEYKSVDDGNELAMRTCLAEGYPFTYGFAVYDSFWDVGEDGAWDGTRGDIDGYHAVDAWGYDFRPGAFGFDEGGYIIRNEWGEEWGDEGYFYVPRRYMTDEAFDCWTIRKVKR